MLYAKLVTKLIYVENIYFNAFFYLSIIRQKLFYLIQAFTPVEPKPPAPRSVSSSLSVFTKIPCVTGATIS